MAAARKKSPIPTPAMIHALFVALRALGWRSGLEHTHGPMHPAPDPVSIDAATPIPTAEQVETLFEHAGRLGWLQLSNEEYALVFDLRSCTAEGYALFAETAACISFHNPWMPNLADSCAGAYKVPHYAMADKPPPAAPLPREQALFAVLRRVGIHADQERGRAPLRPPPLPAADAPPPKQLTRAQHDAASAFAMELGWVWLGPRQIEIIRLLRRSNAQGREALLTTLAAILRRHRLR